MPNAPYQDIVVTYSRPDRLENPDNFLADDFDDEEIESAVEELAPICDGFRRHSFAWQYELGKVVRKHLEPIQKERNHMYGNRFFNRLARDLDRPNICGQLLANCFRLVKRYSEPEYLQYVQQAAVSPTHLLMLAGIEDRKLRDELIEQVIADKLTTVQLQAAIKEKFGLRHPGKPGRPLKIPKDVKAGMTHLEAQAEQFVKLNEQCWFGKQFNLTNEINKLPADKLTDDFKNQLSSIAAKCESLATTAAQDARALRQAISEVERRMVAQAELNVQIAEQEREEEERELAISVESRSQAAGNWKPPQDRRIGRERHAL